MENFFNRRQIVYIHGGQAFDTKEEFFEYLKTTPFNPFESTQINWPKTLETLGEGYEVAAPIMPQKFNAKYEEWKIWFERLIPFLKDGVTFIGWSLGANFIAKYLSENRLPVRIGAVHMVAGCFGWAGGFVLPESLTLFAKQAERIFLYHSKDDTLVPFSDFEKYATALPHATRVIFSGRGHFTQPEFPELMDNIIKTGPRYR